MVRPELILFLSPRAQFMAWAYVIFIPVTMPTIRADSPLSGPAALASFHLPEDLAIELVAAEPEVADPVAVAWDAAGRLFVAEMGDYPARETGGRIRLLEDMDADGQYETSHVFADGLRFPTSIAPWRAGILVAAAPDLVYLEDSDGDRRADKRQVLVTGFGEGNQQLRVNGLHWGLDNWLHGANGRSNGELRVVAGPGAKVERSPLPLASHDWRYHPRTGELERTAGFSQFGKVFDDLGRDFVSWNTIPIRHVVIEQRYLQRRVLPLAGGPMADISDPADGGKVYPITAPQPRFNREPTDAFNASCGIAIERGNLLPPAYRGNAFVCEPLGNLVHRMVLHPAGATFRASRAPEDKTREFLASTDPWFRPVNLASGPDGAFYIVDFYREWVEHPQFVPDELEKGIDFARGAGLGRIYRVVPRGEKRAPPIPNFALLAPAALVEILSSPVGWQRETAQRLLVERADASVVKPLEAAARSADSPLGRLHALATLGGLASLADETLAAALADPDSGVRELALRLAESRFGQAKNLATAARGLASDPDQKVRFQLALSLTFMPGSEGLASLAEVARRDGTDPWVRAAVSCASAGRELDFLSAFTTASGPATDTTDHEIEIIREAARGVGFSKREEAIARFARWLESLEDGNKPLPPKLAASAGLADGLKLAGSSMREQADRPMSTIPISKWSEQARRAAADAGLPDRTRALAVALLAQESDAASFDVLAALLDSESFALQKAAANALGERADTAVAARLLEHWEGAPPRLKRELALAVARHPSRLAELASALEDKTVQASDLDLDCREQMLATAPAEIAQRLKTLFAANLDPNRRAVVESYCAKLADANEEGGASATRGAELFKKNCSGCHRIHGQGPLVGPELSGLAVKRPEQLVADILDPNREVLPNFVSYVGVTKDGEVFSGLLVAETDAAVTLRRAEGAEATLPRSELEQFRHTGRSLMPEGFEQQLSPDDLAALVRFLRAPRLAE